MTCTLTPVSGHGASSGSKSMIVARCGWLAAGASATLVMRSWSTRLVSRGDDDACPVLGDHRHVALARVLGLRVGRGQVDALGDRAQDDLLLDHRQRGAQAAPDAAAERDPRVRAGLAAEEALGPEGERVGVDVLAVVDEDDAR